ncbi:MAG: tRNA (N6-threonylcarbamoyladenosine(37)-N6)-methyltransferase TrmO [Desulfosalsimonadaceae bacterium]
MKIELEPIGTFYTDAQDIPRHWSISEVTGRIEIDQRYAEGLKSIKAGDRIVVLFHFHKSGSFTPQKLVQNPPHRNKAMGVFSICSPYRPNPIGLSVLEVVAVEGSVLTVRHADMIDGTPIIDIKPYIADKHDCPSYKEAQPGSA